jgi:ABC-type sugar transport system ATPase subunit
MSSLLEMRNIAVEFGRVRVLDGADLLVTAGEIHALLGENGAGKSSLMKVLFGLYQKVDGQIQLNGERVETGNPEQALAHGIAMIHQELPFALHLTVAQNIFLGREYRKSPFRFVDEDRQNAEALELLRPFPVNVDPRRLMGSLSVAQQQIIAIAKALSTGARIIVLDEATTALTKQEAERLFEIIAQLKEEGRTFIMITHKLDEVFRIADRVTVMRDGKTITSVKTDEVGPRDLVRAMVGREVTDIFPPRTSTAHGRSTPPLLRVDGLTTRKLKDVSFEVHRGEVVGVAGLMGAGRTSLFHALFGSIPIQSGRVLLNEREVVIRKPQDAIAHGLAYITEDRKGNGLALHLDITENITLPKVRDHVRFGLVDDGALTSLTREFVGKLNIQGKTASSVGLLSGGNQQKVVLAKWLATGADVFLLDEPTRGIDVGTKLDVYALVNELTEAGKAVLLVTSELPELMAMSDRFLIFSEGCLVRELTRDEASPEAVIYYASMKPELVE